MPRKGDYMIQVVYTNGTVVQHHMSGTDEFIMKHLNHFNSLKDVVEVQLFECKYKELTYPKY